MHSRAITTLSGWALCICLSGAGFANPRADPPATTLQDAASKTFLTHKEALALAFPGCDVKRKTAFLTKVQAASIAKASKTTFTSTVVYPYVATKKGKLVGTAYFDTHRVRTLKQTMMVVVGPKGKVSRIELMAFGEPKQYIPSKKWYAQIIGLKLGPKLKLNAKVRNMTGATMTARASISCTRRVLALHEELNRPKPSPKKEPRGKKSKAPSKVETTPGNNTPTANPQ